MSEVVIKAENLTKMYKMYDKPSDRFKETFSIGKKNYYKEFYAMNNVSFEICEGETVGIIGRNGSGKSTLLKMLTGVLNPTSGLINVNGKVSALLELGAGFNQEFTGMENIFLNGTIMNIPRSEMEKRVPDILAFADIGEHINQPVKTYSSGMFVRLAFAVAINVEPDILIVDEALAVGDTHFQLKCMDKFVEFMKAGKTILFVSHDINSIKRFCKRSIWLNQGTLIMDGNTDEVTDHYLDFLKSELPIEEYLDSCRNSRHQNTSGQTEPIEFKSVKKEADIAEFQSIAMFDDSGNEITEITHGQNIYVRIKYYVSDLNVKQPVIGVAIRSIDNKYICGLNTLLDNVEISWELGENQCELQYDRFNLTGGNYYFDVAIFDKTATVPIDYRSKIKTFFVKMDYIAEGVVVLNHHWKIEK
ncbi:MAG: ABC transporter ATP-binding protein [Lachnospiraceae bacterium]|nr:ABC transporter ATP-binding protein [Lachnospiraceae bacterium]